MVDYNVLAQSQASGFNAAMQGRQQFNQNQQLRMQQQAFEAEQAEMAKRERTNQLLAGLLDPQTAEMITMQTPVGAIQAPRQQVQGERFGQLAGLNPQAAVQFQQMQQQRAQQQREQEKAQATELVMRAQYVVKSARPSQVMKLGFPEFYESMREMDIDPDAMSDDDWRSAASDMIARFGPVAGIGPEDPAAGDPFTLSPGQTRFDPQGRPIANIAPDESEKDPTDKTFARANTLRDEFSTKSQPYRDMIASHETLKAVLKDGTGAGDIAGVAAFMRAVDPGSRVTGAEQATAENAGGVPAAIRSYYNKLLGEGSLSPEIRADFLKQAGNLVNARTPAYKALRKEYATRAKRFNVESIDVIGQEDVVEAGPDVTSMSDDDLRKALGIG